MARDRPSPYGEVPFFSRSAGACPPRTLEYARHGEGQALALRSGKPSRPGGLSYRETIEI